MRLIGHFLDNSDLGNANHSVTPQYPITLNAPLSLNYCVMFYNVLSIIKSVVWGTYGPCP